MVVVPSGSLDFYDVPGAVYEPLRIKRSRLSLARAWRTDLGIVMTDKREDEPAQRDRHPIATPRGGNLVGDISAIAQSWFGTAAGEAAPADTLPTPGAVPTPEALAAAAEDRGLRVRYAARPVADLREGDFPCVVLDKDGSSRLLVGRTGDLFECCTNGERYTLALDDLTARHSGTVFFVSPRADTPDRTRAVTPAGPASAGSGQPETQQGVLRSAISIMMARYSGTLAQMMLAAIIGNTLLLALPIFSMSVYDRVVPHLAFETLWALTIGIGLALLADLAIRSVRLRLADAVAVGTALDLQATFYRRLMHAKIDQVPRHASTLSVGMREIEAVCAAVPALVLAFAVDLPFVVLATWLLFALGGIVALVPLGCGIVLVLLYAVTHFAGEAAARRGARLAREQSGLLHETVDSLEVVKASTAEEVMLTRWERLADQSAVENHQGRHWSAFAAHGAATVAQFAIVMSMVVSVYGISQGAMTLGAMSACTLIIGRMMPPIGQAVAILHKAWHLSHTLEAIDAVLRAPQEVAGDPTKPAGTVPHGAIDLRGVAYTYPGAADATLTDIRLTIRPGEKVAIIGRVGSGKSTLIRLLMRMAEPSAGTVLIDGCDIRQVAPRALRRRFGFMRQDPALFDDTLRANLALGVEAASEQDLARAARIAGVHDFAARHPNGYGLRVGPRGERLSGGERQAVALARALIGDPRVLVLDEPTSAMDNTVEARIVADLKTFCEGRTLIVATHRAPLLALVDRIIWMEGGKVAADGPKAEILSRLGQAA
jgi:ATP-binding cassette subfamily C protein LapB